MPEPSLWQKLFWRRRPSPRRFSHWEQAGKTRRKVISYPECFEDCPPIRADRIRYLGLQMNRRRGTDG